MNVHVQSMREPESQFIQRLRRAYEDKGFTFTVRPDAAQLPDFLGTYRPGALARKPGRNVAIEIKRWQGEPAEWQLTDITRLFDGHPDWQFNVVFMGTDPLDWMVIPTYTVPDIVGRMNEVRALLAQGLGRPAFILAWSLLETTLRSLRAGKADRPMPPGTVIQALAMNGYIEPETERRLHTLTDLREHIVHGDLLAEPSTQDVESVLSAIAEAISEAAASDSPHERRP